MNPIQTKKVIIYYFRKIIIFIIAMVIAGIIGMVYTTKFKTPMYSSSTTMVLTKLERDNNEEKIEETPTNQTSNNTKNTTNNKNTTNTKNVTSVESTKSKTNTMQSQEYEFDSYIVTDYCKLATREKLIENVITKLGLKETVKELKKKITVSEIESTNMFTIKAEHENPETAKNIVEALSEELQSKSKEIYSIDNIYDLQEAKVAEEPYNAGKIKDIGIALLSGFLIAFVIVTLMYYFKDTDI